MARVTGGWGRTTAVVAVALAVAGCAGEPLAGTPTTVAPGAPRADATLPVTADGAAYAPLALTVADLPPGWMSTPGLSASQVAGAQGPVATPAECGQVGALRDGSAGNSLLVVLSRTSPANSLAEVVSPAGTPTLDDVVARAGRCATYSQTDASSPEPQVVSVQVVDAPVVPGSRSVGVRLHSDTTYQGVPLSIDRVELLTEVRGALVSVAGTSGTKDPLDTAVLDAAFTTAVARLAGG